MMRPVRTNPVKERLLGGGTVLGVIAVEFNTVGMSRLAAAAGADFVIYDMEHGGLDIGDVRTLTASARVPGGAVPLVRSASNAYHLIAPPLDAGAMGVMVPMVETAADARAIVDAARYPPAGRRGVGVYLPDDVEPDGLAATVARANEEILTIAQIETREGVENVDEIVAVDGIDALWIGHFDLTTSLGAPGSFWTAEHRDAVDRVMEAARRAGKPVGSMANDVDDAKRLLAMGFRAIILPDVGVFLDALRAAVEALRG